MDLDALKGFLAIVEAGSMLGAATSLRWSRATLRRRVDELEAFVGVPLLVRTEQGATPTVAGEELARRGRALLVESTAMLSSVRAHGALPTNMVRVVLPVGLPPRLLALVAAAQNAETPELRVQFRFAEDPLALLLDDVDVAITFGGDLPEGPWVSREILRMPERLAASPSYLAAHGTPRTLDELATHKILLWEPPEKSRSVLPLRAGGELPVSPLIAGADLHVLRECASAGLGMVYGPDPRLPDALTAGPELLPVLEDLVGRSRVIHAVVAAARSSIPRIRMGIERLLEIVTASNPPG